MLKKTLSHQTADTIFEMIVEDRDFSPGQKLPGENILSERLHVSRNTLREAIKILVSRGILEVYRGKGTYVAEDLKAFGDYGLSQMDTVRTRLKDLYEVRLLIEPELAALACARATDDEMAHIVRLAQQAEQAVLSKQNEQAGENASSPELRKSTEQEFHGAIIAAAHNDFMMKLTPIINNAVKDALYVGKDMETQLNSLTLVDHPVIMEFLKKRDPIGTRQAMSLHLRRVIDILNLDYGEHPII